MSKTCSEIFSDTSACLWHADVSVVRSCCKWLCGVDITRWSVHGSCLFHVDGKPTPADIAMYRCTPCWLSTGLLCPAVEAGDQTNRLSHCNQAWRIAKHRRKEVTKSAKHCEVWNVARSVFRSMMFREYAVFTSEVFSSCCILASHGSYTMLYHVIPWFIQFECDRWWGQLCLSRPSRPADHRVDARASELEGSGSSRCSLKLWLVWWTSRFNDKKTIESMGLHVKTSRKQY